MSTVKKRLHIINIFEFAKSCIEHVDGPEYKLLKVSPLSEEVVQQEVMFLLQAKVLLTISTNYRPRIEQDLGCRSCQNRSTRYLDKEKMARRRRLNTSS